MNPSTNSLFCIIHFLFCKELSILIAAHSIFSLNLLQSGFPPLIYQNCFGQGHSPLLNTMVTMSPYLSWHNYHQLPQFIPSWNYFFGCLPGYSLAVFSVSFTSSFSSFPSLNVGELQNAVLGPLLFSLHWIPYVISITHSFKPGHPNFYLWLGLFPSATELYIQLPFQHLYLKT